MAEVKTDVPAELKVADAPKDFIKQMAVSATGELYVLSHGGRVFHGHRDEKHFGLGVPSRVWDEVKLPVLG